MLEMHTHTGDDIKQSSADYKKDNFAFSAISSPSSSGFLS